jgi:hypothetical protein
MLVRRESFCLLFGFCFYFVPFAIALSFFRVLTGASYELNNVLLIKQTQKA